MKKGMKYILLVLFIVVCASSTYAIFRDGLNGTGSMSAAVWDVTLNQNGVDNSLSIIPSPNEVAASYTVNITSVSEVNVVYYIVVDNLPTGVSVDLDGNGYIPEENHKVVFDDFEPILYSATNKNRTHVLSFKASASAGYVNNSEVNIDVVARQQV